MSNNNITFSTRLASLFCNLGKIEIRINSQEGKAAQLSDIRKLGYDIFNELLGNNKAAAPFRENVKNHLTNENDPVFKILNDAEVSAYLQNKINPGTEENLHPLTSLTAKVQVDVNKPVPSNKIVYHLPKKLGLTTVLPEEANKLSAEIYSSVADAYKKLLDEFKEEVKSVQCSTPEALIDTLLFIFEKYFCYIPASTAPEDSDVSLFDHIKSVFAITECMTASENTEQPFLLISADISGIQSFIYSDENPIENTTRGTSKRLRGKSFYLVLLTETVSMYLLDSLNLTRANLLMNGGGHFIAVVPNTKENIETVNKVRKETAEYLFRKFRGRLTLVSEMMPAGKTVYTDFPVWYSKMSDLMQKAKRRKNFQLLNSSVMNEIDSVFKQKADFWIDKEERKDYNNLNDYEKELYHLEKGFEDSGTGISRAQYLVCEKGTFFRPLTDKKEKIEYSFLSFEKLGYNWYFVTDDIKLNNLLGKSQPTNGEAILYCVNNPDKMKKLNDSTLTGTGMNLAIGFKFIGNYSVPKQTGTEMDVRYDDQGNIIYEGQAEGPLEFDKLAELGLDASKLDYPLLSVLRLDVDNLGACFMFGFERDGGQKSIFSLSRTVGLSREMNQFFCGYVNHLARSNRIYITYSGGDDLFVVGSWINIIDFALQLREEFGKLSGQNPNLTLSAGMHISKPNYPVVKAAKYAGEAEEEAKSVGGKDGFALFGRANSWKNQKVLITYGKEISDLIDDETPEEKDDDSMPAQKPMGKRTIKSSFIHKLLGYTELMFNKDGSFNPCLYFEMLGKLKYMFARSAGKMNNKVFEDEKKKEKENKGNLRDDVRILGKLVYEMDSQTNLANFKIPASYAILKNRKSKK